MKTTLFFVALLLLSRITATAQCHYIPSTSTSTDTLTYHLLGGAFASNGCAPIDPNYWISGSGATVRVDFVNPQTNPSFRVWGMNDDDSASVIVNGVSYPLNASSASYSAKVVCGLSPGPDGVMFASGKLVGANTNSQGNFSYQDITLNAANIATFTVTGVSGAGWGFAGVNADCQIANDISPVDVGHPMTVYPNPFSNSTAISTGSQAPGITIKVCDLYGRTVRTITNLTGNSIRLDRDGLPSGTYFIQLIQAHNILETKKLVVVD